MNAFGNEASPYEPRPEGSLYDGPPLEERLPTRERLNPLDLRVLGIVIEEVIDPIIMSSQLEIVLKKELDTNDLQALQEELEESPTYRAGKEAEKQIIIKLKEGMRRLIEEAGRPAED